MAKSPKQTPPAPPPGPSRLTDLGNAERLVARHGDDIRWCANTKAWHVWDGIRWAEDTTLEVERRAAETVRHMYAEAADVTDRQERGALVEWAEQSEHNERIKAMLNLAKPMVPVAITAFDADPWALNTPDGIVDLRTGKLAPHRREALCSKVTGAKYDPRAKCPTWTAFLEKILPDAEVRSFLQRAAGYSLAGTSRESAMLVLWGEGRNGKSRVKETLLAAAGGYGQNTDPDTFLVKAKGAVREDLATLYGSRLVTSTETERNVRLAVATVKMMTGEDSITCRHLFSKRFTYIPQYTCWLATNYKPIVVAAPNDPIWDRLKLVEFPVRFWLPDSPGVHTPGFEADTTLQDKLLAELPGVLRWMVEGCVAWLTHGLGVPPAVVASTRKYNEEMDTLGDFLRECEDVRQGGRVEKTALYLKYVPWAEQRRERPLRQAEFDKALEQRGWQAKRIPHSGRAGWLIPDEPDSDTRYRGEAVKQGEAENDTFVTSRSIEQPLQSALTAPHPLTPEPDKLQPSGPVVDRNAFSRTRRQRREHQGTIPH